MTGCVPSVNTETQTGKNIVPAVREVLEGELPKARVTEKWDGMTAERIVETILALDARG